MAGLTDLTRRLIELELEDCGPTYRAEIYRALLQLDNTVTLLEAQLRALQKTHPDLFVPERIPIL